MSTPAAAPPGREPFRSPLVRWAPYALLAVVLVVAIAISGTRKPERNLTERTQQLAATIRCPSCTDESMATSNSATSVAGRAEIARRLKAGQSSGEIRAFFAARYGDQVLLTPKRSGFDALVWAVPVVVFVVGAAGLGAAFLRWHRLAGEGPTPADLDLVERARHGEAPPSGAGGDDPASADDDGTEP